MSKNRYFLMSRDKDSNEVVRVPFCLDEIINNGDKRINSENMLCDIDLFTTRFHDKSELIVYLYKKGIISSYDSDIFIVSRNGDNINTMECVYGDDYFGKELRSIAFRKRNKEYDNLSISLVFDDFARRMYSNDKFYSFVTYGFSDIYPKFVDYFKASRNISDMLNSKLRDGAWAPNSYHLIRNIVESYKEYKNSNATAFEIFVQGKKQLDKARKDVLSDIMILTDKDYIEEQVSLFESKKGVDELEYVLSNLDKLRVEAFTENNGVSFNKAFFPKYEGDAFALELSSMLDSDELMTLLNYARDYSAFSISLDYDILDFKVRLEKDKALLLNDFRVNPIFLHKVYSFLLLYNKCMKDNGMDSGEYGRTYQKK